MDKSRNGPKAVTGSGQYDVFLSYSRQDRAIVRVLAQRLADAGLCCGLDNDETLPGVPLRIPLEQALRASRSVAVLIGGEGLSPREDEDLRAVLRLAVQNYLPVILVLLPGALQEPKRPSFISGGTWVDLRPEITQDNFDKLVWEILSHLPLGNADNLPFHCSERSVDGNDRTVLRPHRGPPLVETPGEAEPVVAGVDWPPGSLGSPDDSFDFEDAFVPQPPGSEPGPEWLSSLRAAMAEMKPGRILYVVPEAMKQGVSVLVEARITRDPAENLIKDLRASGVPAMDTIKTASFMTVKLVGETFSITPLCDEDQVISSQGSAYWTWNITPLHSGRQTLFLRVTARIVLPSGIEKKDFPVYSREIAVEINRSYLAKKVFRENWLTFLTAAALPAIGWFANVVWGGKG